jgi:ubiquinone/menaquinone biosynthesis C-methylase UbiE
MTENEPPGRFSFEQYYDDYPRIEEELQAVLRVSLNPRGPDVLYDVINGLGLPRTAQVVDLGCGEGVHALELARRFGVGVIGVDPVGRHIELANDAVASLDEDARKQVRFQEGRAEDIPLDDGSVDLVCCREMLYHVPVLELAFAECRRILKRGGHVVIYQLFSTERLEPREAEGFWGTTDTFSSSTDRVRMEAAIAAAGLRIEQNIELGSETGEWAEEHHGKASQELLSASRLLRDPERYVEQFGAAAYEIKLADSFWHVYRMIGKLSNRIYVLGRVN